MFLLGFEMLAEHAPFLGRLDMSRLLFTFLNDHRFLAYGLAGAFILHMWTHPGRLEYSCIIAVSCGLCLVALLEGETINRSVYPSFLGIGSLGVLCWKACKNRDPVSLRNLAAAFLVPLAALATEICLPLTYLVQARSHDVLLYRFDQTLGFQPSIIMARLFDLFPGLRFASNIAYGGLPAIVCVLYAVQREDKNAFRVNLIAELGIATAAGFLMYFVYPAAGPKYLLGANFPLHPPSPAELRSASLVHVSYLNAMPSLHMTWALLLWWNTLVSKLWLRLLTAFTLVFTVCATLGLGEHYLADLAVAFPFALIFQGVCSVEATRRLRYAAVGIGGGFASCFLLFLRYGIPFIESHPGMSWAFVIVTIGMSSLMARLLLNESGKLRHHAGVKGDEGNECCSARLN